MNKFYLLEDMQSELDTFYEGLNTLSYVLRCCIDEKAMFQTQDIRGIGIILEMFEEKQKRIVQRFIDEIKMNAS
jgi:hypothetical protein